MFSAVNEFLDDLRGGRMSEAPVVKVEQGQLQGKVVNAPSGKAYFAFQGVPYAKPPLGSLRFKAPEPHEPWDGIRDATSEGNVSAQIDIVGTKSYTGDENCLFLNIFTPNLERPSLPVMIFIPGGGLIYGSGNTDFYGPDYLVEKEVVVVTLNYRLGALGFLCLNTPDVPGNAGLKDVILALKWVKENIHNFGGNPENLTIFGESAGGAIVSVLTASPLSKNLISRAIIQSGTALPSWFNLKTPLELARKLVKALGSEANSEDEILELLSVTSARDIVEAQAKISSFDNVVEEPPIIFSLVVEKDFPGVEAVTTEPFIDLLKSGRVAQIPIIIGSTALEFGFEKRSDLRDFIPEEFNIEKDSETSLAIAGEIKRCYFKETEETLLEYCQLISDKFLNVDTHRYVQYLLKSTNIPVYFYKFDYVGELNISHKISSSVIQNESMHGDDLGYLFKNDFHKEVEPTPQDLKMRERMVRLWTNFAKTGNPTPDENHVIKVTWLPAAKGNEYYLHLAKELNLGSNYDKEKMEFWDGLYEKYYKIWDQPHTNIIEPPRKDPVIAETHTTVTSSSEFTHSSEMVETVREIVKTSTELVETSGELVETSSELVETSSRLVETAPKLVETTSEVVGSQKVAEKILKIEETNGTNVKPQIIKNGAERQVKKNSSQVKMVQNRNGVPKDVIRANDPPEDDLPKNIGVNKFVNFFESLGGKK